MHETISFQNSIEAIILDNCNWDTIGSDPVMHIHIGHGF